MALVTLVALAAAPGVQGIVDVSVTDATVALIEVQPTAPDPGPVAHDPADGLTFASNLTTVEVVWSAQIVRAVNETGAVNATIQGNDETFVDWFYGKQDAAAKYASFNATGAYDADAGSYTVPTLFAKDSQGSIVVRGYDGTTPASGGTDVTYYWAYDSGTNRYVFGSSKNLSSATQVAPTSDLVGPNYVTTMEANEYVVASVGTGPEYIPTLRQGHHILIGLLPAAYSWFVLADLPLGVHASTYDYTLRVTAESV